MPHKQLKLDLPVTQPLTDIDRLHNRLALGTEVVRPEPKHHRDQHELFDVFSRAAIQEAGDGPWE